MALAARLPGPPVSPPARGLELAWTHRGAPHWHEPGTRRGWADALRPLGDDDAAARLNWSAPHAEQIGIAPLAAIDRVAAALAYVVREPMTKGEVSGAVSTVLPRALQYDCVPCGATHVYDQVLRLGAGPAGLVLDPSGRTVRLTPPPAGCASLGSRDTGRGRASGDGGRAGPGSGDDRRPRGLGGDRDVAAAARGGGGGGGARGGPRRGPARLGGRRPARAVADPPAPPRLRLLPPFDPLIAGRDRALLVPETERRRVLWPALGHPGAVLADGEVVGTWRPQASGKKLTLTVTAFVGGAWPGLDEEAARVAAARGLRLAGMGVA